MASFRNALFLFVVVVGGVNSATLQQRDYKHISSVWSAKMSALDMFSLRKNHENGRNTAGVNGVKCSCLPDLMTATVLSKETTVDERQQSPDIRYSKQVIYHDQANKRLAVDTTGNNVTWSYIYYIIVCNESGGTQYDFTRAAKLCRKEQSPYCTLDPGRTSMCFPPNGTLLGSFHLGAGPGALAAQLWNYSDIRRPDVAEVVLTPDDCVPVVLVKETRFSRRKVTTESVYTDVALSISDPSVFEPPSYCNQEE